MGQRLGSLIGAIGGLVFVLINAGPLPGQLSLGVRLIGIVIFVFAIWYAVVRTRTWPRDPAPPRQSLRTYWACVAAEVVAIPAGSLLLVRVFHQPTLTPVWVVFVVGMHFIPFARAFHVPLFTGLAVGLIVVALIGGVVTLAISPVGAAWAGVAAGLLLLAFAIAGARRKLSVPRR